MRVALLWIREHRTRVFWSLTIVLVALLAVVRVTHAQSAEETALNFIINKLTELVQWFIHLMGELVLFLVALLISVAKYNDFTRAWPVETGWVLVRDVANMFFIVVLLVIAFSTIIGYEPFHYKKYLPKLLLMAVLINFSKTLIGVLIDFSQVIMLTFVNGFQAAAGGNFMNAFKLTKVTQLNTNELKQAAAAGQGAQTPENLLLASVLGLGMLVISAAVILVMLIYLLARIVGLWILLIMSPIAFFALAVPDKLKNALSAFTKDFWGKLSALLTGGPIMAFFLWLSLATVQGSPATLTNMYGTQSATEEQQNVAITMAGDPRELTSFIVAVVMLLVGLSTAVSITKQVSPEALALGKAAGALGVGAAAYIGRRTARAGIGAAAGTARYIDRKGQFTERAGKFALRGAAAIGASRIPGSGLIAGRVARAGASLTGVSATRRAARGAELEKMSKHLPPADRLNFLAGMEGANANRLLGDPEMAEAASMRAMKIKSSKEGMRMARRDLENNYYSANGVTEAAASPDQKERAKAYADAYSERDAGTNAIREQEIARKRGDEARVHEIDEELSKNLARQNDFSKLSRVAANKVDDYKEFYRGTQTETWKDSAAFLANMKAVDLVGTDGKLIEGYQDAEAWKELTRHGGNRAKYAEAHAFNLKSAEGQTKATVQLAAMKENATAQEKKAAEDARYSVSLSSDAKAMMFTDTKPQRPGEPFVPGEIRKVDLAEITGAPRAMGNINEVTRDLTPAQHAQFQTSLHNAGMGDADIQSFAARFNQPLSGEAAGLIATNAAIYAAPPPAAFTRTETSEMAEIQLSGVNSSAAFNYDREHQTFRSPADRTAAGTAYTEYLNNMADANATPDDRRLGMALLANTDLDALKKGGQLMDVVSQAMENKIKHISENFQRANRADRKKIEEIVKQIAIAGDKALQKPATAVLTDTEKHLIELRKEIASEKRFKKLVGEETRT